MEYYFTFNKTHRLSNGITLEGSWVRVEIEEEKDSPFRASLIFRDHFHHKYMNGESEYMWGNRVEAKIFKSEYLPNGEYAFIDKNLNIHFKKRQPYVNKQSKSVHQ